MVALRLCLFGSLLLTAAWLPAPGHAASGSRGPVTAETDASAGDAGSAWSAVLGYAVVQSSQLVPPAQEATAGVDELQGVRAGIAASLAPGGSLRMALVAADGETGSRIAYGAACYAVELGPPVPGIALLVGYEFMQAVHVGSGADRLAVSGGGPSAGIGLRIPLGSELAAHLDYLAIVGGDGAFDRPARRLREHVGGHRYAVRLAAARAPLEIEYAALSIWTKATGAAGTWTLGSAGWRMRW